MKAYALPQPVDGHTTWHDGKRYLWLLGLVAPSVPFLAVGVHALTGFVLVLWLGPIIILVIVPLLDLDLGLDPTNPPDEVMEALEEDRYYRWVVWAYLPLQYGGMALSMWYIATQDAGPVADIGLALTVGTVAGIGINTAHELGHKREEIERWAARIALAQCFYGHFYIEHNRGHHVRVATPQDPASSRMGESFYRFWPRTVVGSLASAWRLERKRFARRDQHPFRLGNDVLNAWLMSALLWGALIAVLGIGILPYLVLQAVFGFTLLELVNYMEHYGMLRQQVGPPGRRRYERVSPAHSWNSNNIATNVLLYHLQRHSDHHANPTRRFQTLRDFPDSPVLPTGYAGMMVLALIPPLFRRAMDHRVVAHYRGDLRLANLHPRRRAALLAAYPPPADPIDLDRADSVAPAAGDDIAGARCPGCGHTYEVVTGNEVEGIPAGTAWADVPNDWSCPDCGVRDKVDFIPLTRTEA